MIISFSFLEFDNMLWALFFLVGDVVAVGLLHWTGIEVEVQEKQFTFIVTLFIQKYKWVLAKCQGSWLKFWGVALILFVASCYKNQCKLRLDGTTWLKNRPNLPHHYCCVL